MLWYAGRVSGRLGIIDDWIFKVKGDGDAKADLHDHSIKMVHQSTSGTISKHFSAYVLNLAYLVSSCSSLFPTT